MSDPAVAVIDKPTIVNWALVELGLAPKFSVDEATTLGALVDIFWPRAIGEAFGVHDWAFCRQTFLLDRQAATPVTGYLYGFDLPGGRIGAPVKYGRNPTCDDPIRDTRIEGRTLFCNEPAVYCVCRMAVDPSTWDLQWASCFAVVLASMLAIPLRDDAELQAAKWQEAFGSPREAMGGGKFGRLIAQDRAANPVGSNLLMNDPLTSARGSGSWYGRW